MENSLKQCVWEEIHGFTSPSEYTRFVKYIEQQVADLQAEEIIPNPNYGKGEIYGGRWFRHVNCLQVWRLVEPDYPFKGLWEPVEHTLGTS